MKKQLHITTFLFLSILIFPVITHAQTLDEPFFTVEGEVLKPLKLTWKDLAGMKQTEVKTIDRNDQEHTFQGVRLVDILDSAGVTLGKELRGENLVKYLLIQAADGYEVIFSLPEVDPEFTDQTILLAYLVDGNPLPKGEGPFRIVAPNDKRPARWIRELSTIKVLFSKE